MMALEDEVWSMRLIIFGGSGFVGQAIICAARKRQIDVISISRRGRPKGNLLEKEDILWVSADVFQPETWVKYIQKGDVILDAIGIFFQQSKKGITYKRMHFDAANIIAQKAKEYGASYFIYISAAHGIPFFKGYIEWKQRAENSIQKIMGNTLIFQPSLLYSQHHQYAMAKGILIAKKIPGLQYLVKKIEPMDVEVFANRVLKKIN